MYICSSVQTLLATYSAFKNTIFAARGNDGSIVFGSIVAKLFYLFYLCQQNNSLNAALSLMKLCVNM